MLYHTVAASEPTSSGSCSIVNDEWCGCGKASDRFQQGGEGFVAGQAGGCRMALCRRVPVSLGAPGLPACGPLTGIEAGDQPARQPGAVLRRQLAGFGLELVDVLAHAANLGAGAGAGKPRNGAPCRESPRRPASLPAASAGRLDPHQRRLAPAAAVAAVREEALRIAVGAVLPTVHAADTRRGQAATG